MFKIITKLILGTSLLAAFFPPGVPSNPPFPVSGTKTTGYVPTVQSDGTVAWAAGGGGGISASSTPVFGETLTYNDFTDTYDPAKPGAGVFDVTGYGASGRGETTTTGTASGSSTALTLASASTFAKGQGIAILGAGATHAVSAPAAPLIGTDGTDNDVTYTYSLYSLTGDGGWSTASSTGASTDAVAGACGSTALSFANCNFICWATVSGAEGYGICGRGSSNRFTLVTLNGAPNARRLTFGADPNFTIADIGTTVTQATTGHTGILLSFSNTGRVAYVKPTVFGTDSFSGTANSTTAVSGRGGTTNAAAGNAHYWQDSGDTSALAHTVSAGAESGGSTQPSFCRRASTQYFPGQRFIQPFSNAGVQYIVTKVTPTASNYATTSATATGSVTYDSTVGVETADGDITVMPMPAFFPVAEPGSAKPNAHLTTIAAISGPSVTLAAATGNAVTSQVVMHNDWKAISDARTAQTAANVKANELYFPAGNYNVITGDSEVNTWTQWTDSGTGLNILFGGTNELARSWSFADGASTYWMPLSHRALQTDSGDKDFFWCSLGFNQPRWKGGRFIYSPAAEPIITASDAWNRVLVFGDYSTGATQFAQCVEFRGAEFWGNPRFCEVVAQKGYGRGHKMHGCTIKYGGAGHDSCTYGAFSEICNSVFYGDVGFGSDIAYTDDGATDTVNDTFLFSGNRVFRSRNNGCRMRTGRVIIANNHWTDSFGDIILCDSTFDGVIANNTALNGGRFNLAGYVNWSNNFLTNVQIFGNGFTGSVSGGQVLFTTAADSYLASAEYCVQHTGGADAVYSGLVVTNNETSGPTRGIKVSSTGRTTLNGLHVYASSGLGIDVTSGMTGTVLINGGYYRSGSGPQGHYLTQHASGTVVAEGVTFDSSAASNTIYSTAGAMRLHDCTLLCALEIGPHVCELVDNTVSGGTASIISCFTSLKADGNEWSLAPTDNTPSKTFARGNRIAAVDTSSPSALASGSTNDYALSIADNQRLDPNAANSTLTGIVACADGTEKTITNVDAGAATVTLDEGATASVDANEFTFVGGDLTIPAGQSATIKYDGTSAKWRLKSKTF